MNKMEWIAPCHFGLESVLKREIQDLGYEISQVEDGRVTFYGEADAACRSFIEENYGSEYFPEDSGKSSFKSGKFQSSDV